MPGLSAFTDNHPAAALRHYHDAVILHDAQCRENSLCHYAFSVECAQKALLCWSTGKSVEGIQKAVRKTGHNIADSWVQVQAYLKARSSLDCRLAGALPNLPLPPVLYDRHPERRYQKKYVFSDVDLENCRTFAKQMEQTVISLIIDGIITV